jgi:hypothetical protein
VVGRFATTKGQRIGAKIPPFQRPLSRVHDATWGKAEPRRFPRFSRTTARPLRNFWIQASHGLLLKSPRCTGSRCPPRSPKPLQLSFLMSSPPRFFRDSSPAGAPGRRRSQFTYRHLSQMASYSTTCPLRVIAHMDLDAFYAQCEMVRLGTPEGQPLAVQQWYQPVSSIDGHRWTNMSCVGRA